MRKSSLRDALRKNCLRFSPGTLLPTALLPGLLLLSAPPVWAQAAAAQSSPKASTQSAFGGFDVVSIKPNKSGSGSSRISARETTFQATNVSLKMLLVNAYGVRDALISGLPKWAEDARWDINAKLIDPPSPEIENRLTREQSTEQYRTKVRSILTERFKLTAHKETRTLPIYELVVMPGPSRFSRSTPAEENQSGTHVNNRDMTGTALTLKDFARFLSDQVDRTVVAKTGLDGTYSFKLKWSPDELAEAAKETGVGDRPPNMYTALQEQLGLKLVAGKGPSEVLVVDSAEPPVLDE